MSVTAAPGFVAAGCHVGVKRKRRDLAIVAVVFADGAAFGRKSANAEGSDEFVLPVTQEELAGMVGASRERVNKAIASFIRLGWLEQADRRYRIKERTKMTARSS